MNDIVCLPEILVETVSLKERKNRKRLVNLLSKQWYQRFKILQFFSLQRSWGIFPYFSVSAFLPLRVALWLFSCWQQSACSPADIQFPRFSYTSWFYSECRFGLLKLFTLSKCAGAQWGTRPLSGYDHSQPTPLRAAATAAGQARTSAPQSGEQRRRCSRDVAADPEQ